MIAEEWEVLRPDTPNPAKVPPVDRMFVVTRIWRPWFWYNVELFDMGPDAWMMDYVEDMMAQHRERL